MAHTYNYDNVVSLTEEEFNARSIKEDDLNNPEKFIKSTSEEIEIIERFLDLRSGILKNEKFYSSNAVCQCCDLTLTMTDFILTALVDAKHEKSLIIQTILGNKLVVNSNPRPIRCFKCGYINIIPNYEYAMPGSYHCSVIIK